MQQGTLSQDDLIVMYLQLRGSAEQCDQQILLSHYEHVLLGLQKLIESYGPTPLYREWLSQVSPNNICANHASP
jgi:hypothetical protein